MTGEDGSISIWFFIGVLLAFYGVVILGYGIYALGQPIPADRVLGELHADVWWGALLLIVGSIYSFKFSPKRKR
jgi:hypothetical protein